ncbi:Cytochrome P450 10 [Chionoecetes opilio]|uniref:Cytochrome P450 10 n=1 Tax=Chionoecetes opilio TaxID=41210 RepID=A0A8J4XWY0_CHIOP|nr:Cytochrome P450 10 [Chionoecetes opilio]
MNTAVVIQAAKHQQAGKLFSHEGIYRMSQAMLLRLWRPSGWRGSGSLLRFTSTAANAQKAAEPVLEEARPASEIPGPRLSFPALMNLNRLKNDPDWNQVHKLWMSLIARYGPIVLVKIPAFPPVIALSSPKDCKELNRMTMNQPHRPQLGSLKKIRDDWTDDYFEKKGGIVLENGDEWWRVRSRVQTPLLKPMVVGEYVQEMDDVSLTFVDRIKELQDKHGEMPENFQEELYKWALECRVVEEQVAQTVASLDQKGVSAGVGGRQTSVLQSLLATPGLTHKDILTFIMDLVFAGIDTVTAELLKARGEAMIRGLHAVLTAVWQSGAIPPDWKRGLVVPIWKGKGYRQDCNNYRGITLLSVPGKVLSHLLLTRIRSHLLKHQRPQQSGFTPGKSTTDRILALRVLVERRLFFAESLEVLVMALEALHEEAKPLGLEVSWLKTKVQTSHTMAFCLYLLARNPEAQKKLQKEVDEVTAGHQGPLTSKHLARLSYTKAVIKESLRILTQDVVMQGYRIPAGHFVFALNMLMGWDASVFHRVDEFLPERWLRDRPMGDIHPYASIPFGAGPRMCVGRRVAEQEMFTLLTRVAQRFTVEYHHEDIELRVGLVSYPSRPLKFSFVSR